MASDAAKDNDRGRAGFLLVLYPGHQDEGRLGRMLRIPREVYVLCVEQRAYVAQLELLVVLAVMLHFAPIVREARDSGLLTMQPP